MDSEVLRKLLHKYRKKEKPNLDFKRELDLTSTIKKIEFTKDIAAMCAVGGFILYGFENDGTPVGIDPATFNEEQISQVIANRCLFTSLGLASDIVNYEEKGVTYKVGVISVPESPFEYPACFKDKNGNWKAPVRVGSTTSFLTPPEAIEYYKAKHMDKPPPFLPVTIETMAVYNLDFSSEKSYFLLTAKPLEAFGKFRTSVPVLLNFVPKLYKVKPVLKCWCGSITGENWLSWLLKVEEKIEQHHSGIIAESWGIRNWDLISPLPDKMEYVVGPSIQSLKETIEEQECKIRKYSYLGWAAVAFKQVLYVLLGQINHHLDLYAYLPYIPQSNEFIHVSSEVVTTKKQNLWFTEVKGTDIVDYSGGHHWSSGYSAKDDLLKLPSVRIVGYMGVPDSGSSFKIQGLHILEVGENGNKIFKDTRKKYGEFFSSVDHSILPSYVNSKLVYRENDEVKLTHLHINVQFFEDAFSIMHLISVNAGLWQES